MAVKATATLVERPQSPFSLRESLVAARKLVAAGWVQNIASDGDKVCASRAVMKADTHGYSRTRAALGEALVEMGHSGWLSTFNDSHTKEDVLALYDLAISRADDTPVVRTVDADGPLTLFG